MRYRALSTLALVSALIACHTAPQNGEEPGPAPRTTITVNNQAFLDMTIYASRSGERIRLGTATGNRETVFSIPANLIRGMGVLRFIADPIGSSRQSTSEEITVNPGDAVVMTIPPA